MASMISSSIGSSLICTRETTRATINIPKLRNTNLKLPKIANATNLVDDLAMRSGYTKIIPSHIEKSQISSPYHDTKNDQDMLVIEKIYAILEAISDRIEMHKNIGEQRNNWNSLLLTSINTITLTASIMTGISAITDSVTTPISALKLSSTMLYLAATGILVIMNKIQPSQLVEEQRKAARLFKQLYEEIHTTVSIGNPNMDDVEEAMGKVLALDKAYPLPLLGVMLEKFPEKVEPAVWWPERCKKVAREGRESRNGNGWDEKMENQMREVLKVVKRNDKVDYLRLGEKALKLNKMLAISGPMLTGVAALGSALVGQIPWAVTVGVLGGALASVVNTIQHGGQVGMVFEMYRSNAGFFKLMEESIESSLNERKVERRENGELVEMKVALQLGRSLSELHDLATSSVVNGEALEEFASKLF